MVPEGRVLAIDFGQKRIGLALSDPLHIIAQGLPTIEVSNARALFDALARVIRENNVSEVVVGLPLSLKGRSGAASEAVEEFVTRFKRHFELPVKYWDERLTSVQARRTLTEMNRKPSRQRHKIDEIAAVLILQNYLDFRSPQLKHITSHG